MNEVKYDENLKVCEIERPYIWLSEADVNEINKLLYNIDMWFLQGAFDNDLYLRTRAYEEIREDFYFIRKIINGG